ncbi:MAG: Fe-S metabolism protein SufE [Marinilabiliales bacterium]|jgi:cysteine desulfuration protein SufE|nr:MAG: Fe-S metabolism protein SufE [Marinilabiliales bacterium]
MTIKEQEKAIVEEFSIFDDWMDKYAYLIELGKELPVIDEKYKTNQYLITGCQSRVWLFAELDNEGKVVFTADSDAVITKGIVSLLVKVLSVHTPKEILDADLEFLDQIGLKEHLSPTRANGLVSMIKQMQFYARAFQLKSNVKKIKRDE